MLDNSKYHTYKEKDEISFPTNLSYDNLLHYTSLIGPLLPCLPNIENWDKKKRRGTARR